MLGPAHLIKEMCNENTAIVLNHLTDTSDMLSGERTALSKAAEKLSAVMANITSENEKEMKFASNDTQAKMQKVSSMLQNFTKVYSFIHVGIQPVCLSLGISLPYMKVSFYSFRQIIYKSVSGDSISIRW